MIVALWLPCIIVAHAMASEIQAQIRLVSSGPALFINGKRIPPIVFFVNFDTEEQFRSVQIAEIASAGKYGVNIISFPLPMPWPRDGESYDYTEVDRRMDAAIEVNPSVLVIPRLGLSWPPQWWREQYPDELMLYADGSRGIASIYSKIWRDAATKHLRSLIRHLERKYSNHIVGYHPCGQNTGEWFFDRIWEGREAGFETPTQLAFRQFLKSKYGTDQNLRKAWGERTITLNSADVPTEQERAQGRGSFRQLPAQQKCFDFDEFQNQSMADIVEYFCRVVKETTPNKLAVVFYGYHFELAGVPRGIQSSGHLGLRRLLMSRYVDIVCSPVSYLDRGPGGGGFFMAPVDSVHLGGKIWLVEDDTRTHLGCKSPDDPVVYMQNMQETKGVLTRNFSHVVTRGAALWWMDLYGRGWYSTDELWQFLGCLKQEYESIMTTAERYRPEIAVIVDEKSCFYLSRSGVLGNVLLGLFRREWYRIGAPCGIYLLDDLVDGRVPPARVYIFLDTFALDKHQIRGIRRYACRKGCTLVWMYASGIVRNGKTAVGNIYEVTGIKLVEDAQADGRITLADGTSFDAHHGGLDPSFAVEDPDVQVLARYTSGGHIAVAAKKIGGWTSVYSGVLQLPASLLRDIAEQAGVHIYCDTGDIVAVGNGVVGIHSCANGSKHVRLRSSFRVIESISGQELRTNDYYVGMRKGDSILLRYVK